MSTVSLVFVGTKEPLDAVGALVSSVIGRAMREHGDALRSEPGQPWVSIHPNDLTPELDEGHALSTYDFIVQLEAGEDRLAVARTIYDAAANAGYRALLRDGDEGFVDQHDPDQRHSAAG